jgi:hypothetical protein
MLGPNGIPRSEKRPNKPMNDVYLGQGFANPFLPMRPILQSHVPRYALV